MYQADAEEERSKGSKPVSSSFYRHTLVTDYTLTFHRPKKDQRLLCTQLCKWWRNKLIVPIHGGEVLRAPKEKKRIKSWKIRRQKWAKVDGSLKCDDIWHAGISPDTMFCRCISHHKRKHAVYNLSVFSLADKQGVLFFGMRHWARKGHAR